MKTAECTHPSPNLNSRGGAQCLDCGATLPKQRLDGVTFEIIVHRLQQPTEYGEWLLRVYAGGEHFYSMEGGVSLDMAVRGAERAMREFVDGFQ